MKPQGVLPARTQPQGGGGGGLYRPQNGCTEQWVLWAPEVPEILFQEYGRGKFFCLTLYVYTQNSQNFVEISKIQKKWMKKHKKGF